MKDLRTGAVALLQGGCKIADGSTALLHLGVEVQIDVGVCAHARDQPLQVGGQSLALPGGAKVDGVAAQRVRPLHQVDAAALIGHAKGRFHAGHTTAYDQGGPGDGYRHVVERFDAGRLGHGHAHQVLGLGGGHLGVKWLRGRC